LPVFNEEEQLRQSVVTLHTLLSDRFDYDFEIVVADNGSTDLTGKIAEDLCSQYRTVRLVTLRERGRGGALKAVWSSTSADILSYMDIDLSTDVRSFTPLIKAVAADYDLAVGSRLHRNSITKRSWRREMISRCYNRILRLACSVQFSDAQCGFKAIQKRAANRLLPAIEDIGWFFDTELLVIAEKCGYRIFDLPVRWVEDEDTRVKLLSTVWQDVKGLMRVCHRLRGGQYESFRKGNRLSDEVNYIAF